MQNPQEEENNGFGPLFEQRGSRSTWTAISILIVFVAVLLLSAQTMDVYFFTFAFSFLAWIIGEVLRRFCLFVEEVGHRHSRYGGSIKKAFKTSFDFKNRQLVALMTVMAFVCTCTLYKEHRKLFQDQFAGLFWFYAIFIPMFAFLFGLREASIVEHSQTNEKELKNLADGLAWTYYFGYLKFVLPELENQIHLTEKYRNKINVQKLFILVPKNCFVFGTISNSQTDPNGLVKVVGDLEPLKRNRGGIQNRVYKHTVHRIKDEVSGQKHFCVMEYPALLMTLHDMSGDPKAGLSREERDIQVNLFVSKLREILDDDKKCREKYKLVTLSGREDQDIGKIMLSALKDSTLKIDD